jgi:hypothetical protein
VLSLDWWSAIAVVCGALLALGALLRQVVKGIRRMSKAWKKFGTLMDQLLGDENNPSLMQVLEDTRATGQATLARVERVEEGLQQVVAAQAEHLEQWHGTDASPTPIQRGTRPRRGG